MEFHPFVPGIIYICNMAVRTGYKGWENLEEYDTYHGTATGVTKPNVPSDPDYVAPVYDPATCSLQEEFLLFTTTSTSPSFAFTLATGSTPVIVEAKSAGTVIYSSTESASSGKTLDLSAGSGNISIWVKGPVGVNGSVTQVVSNSNSVTSENMVAFPNLTRYEFRNNSLTALTVTPAANPDLQYILYNNNSVTGFNPSNFENLFNISAGFNGISSVGTITNVPALEEVSYPGNSLTSFPITSIPLIRAVELQSNNLTWAGLGVSSPVTTIENLFLADNATLTSFDTAMFPNVQGLTIDKTAVSSIVMTNIPDIIYLDITQCPIATFNISTNDDLVSLFCGECTFTADDADPSIIDAVIIKMDANITSGHSLHYDTLVPGGIQPTNASRAAYDSLVLKGTNLQGKVPLP